jgi:hypothetical protein
VLPISKSVSIDWSPLPAGCHPELHESQLLDLNGIHKYQMLIGMAQWACTIGCLHIAFAISSLSHFSANQQIGHLALTIYLFGFLKKYNQRIVLDSPPLIVEEELHQKSFHPDFLEDYDGAKEEIGDGLPEAFRRELETSVFFDADHAHDHQTWRSITGIIVFVGSTPVLWPSKHQGYIAMLSYTAEFVAMRSAVEEAISICTCCIAWAFQ